MTNSKKIKRNIGASRRLAPMFLLIFFELVILIPP